MKRVQIKNLPISSLFVDERAQRAEIGPHLRRLIANFDPAQLGVLTVSTRPGGRFHLIDGQHRWLAARECGLTDLKVKCEVHQGLSLQDEADLFIARNAQRAVSAIDKYQVGLVAKDTECVGVQSVLDRFGYRVAAGTGAETISCPDTIRRVYRKDDGETLGDVLAVARSAWGDNPDALEHIILSSLGAVVGRYNGELDRDRLVKRLSKYPGGPTGLIGNARGLARMKPGMSVARAASESVLDTYNRGLRSGALGS